MDNKNKLNKLYLEKFHIENKAKLMSFANYMMPINYSKGIIFEHLNTRSNAGLFDVSHMLQLTIPADIDIINKLENIIPLNLNNLEIGKSSYSFILNETGGIIDDLIISKLKDKNDNIYFYIVLNASRKEIDKKILSNELGSSDSIKIRNDYSLLALQGPKARKILSEIIPEIINLKFMEIKKIYYENKEIIVSCSGYTGEDGFELSIDNNIIYSILNKLMQYKDISLCGLGSRDTLRLEASLCLYGNELNDKINPKEASLLWAISKERKIKKNFNGADKIITNNESNQEKIRIGMESNSNVIPRHNNKIFDGENNLIGIITSGSYSPSLKTPIAMGIINNKYSKIGNNIFFESRGEKNKATIVDLPFMKHNYKKN